jgi:hypothetical protein
MSLIPSESYSFPDHFTRTVMPSRRPKNEEPETAPVEMRRQKPSIVALPTLTLKPKVRWNMRASAVDPAPGGNNDGEQLSNEAPARPAQNVIQMKPARPARPPRVMPPPESLVPQNPVPPPPNPLVVAKPTRPVQAHLAESPRPVAVSNPQSDLFEMFAQSGETALSKRRCKAKMRRFIACESAALALLLPLAILGLARHPDNVALVWIMNILTIASAVVAALLPIIFFAFTPTLPEIER